MISITILLLGGIIFLKSGAIDYYSLIYAVTVIIPASTVIGLLGYLIGKIFETSNPKAASKKGFGLSLKKHDDLLIDDLLIDDVKNDDLKD